MQKLVTKRVLVAVETPQHTGLGAPLDYRSERDLAVGSLVRVPLGRREVPGLVWPGLPGDVPGELKQVQAVMGSLPPLPKAWCELVEFAAGYYQRGVGEVALSVLPPELRRLDDAQLNQRVAKLRKRTAATPVPPARRCPRSKPTRCSACTNARARRRRPPSCCTA